MPDGDIRDYINLDDEDKKVSSELSEVELSAVEDFLQEYEKSSNSLFKGLDEYEADRDSLSELDNQISLSKMKLCVQEFLTKTFKLESGLFNVVGLDRLRSDKDLFDLVVEVYSERDSLLGGVEELVPDYEGELREKNRFKVDLGVSLDGNDVAAEVARAEASAKTLAKDVGLEAGSSVRSVGTPFADKGGLDKHRGA